jgi:hypothetical protein
MLIRTHQILCLIPQTIHAFEILSTDKLQYFSRGGTMGWPPMKPAILRPNFFDATTLKPELSGFKLGPVKN